MKPDAHPMQRVIAKRNPLHGLLNRAAMTVNDLPLWQCTSQVWGQRMFCYSFERWLYIKAHQVRMMGRMEKRFLDRFIRPGMQILDVGSNIGLYAILMALRAGPRGRVHCFEPDPSLCTVLRKNQILNNVMNLTVHELALGSETTELALHRSIINSGDNHLGANTSPLFRHSMLTRVARLDDYLPGLNVDFIKIDVQGWELAAMEGMSETLFANPQVAVMFEFSQIGQARAGHGGTDLVTFLRARDFRIFEPNRGRELPLSEIHALARTTRYYNLLAMRFPPALPT